MKEFRATLALGVIFFFYLRLGPAMGMSIFSAS
jgi:hypothetical protein